MAGPFLSSTHTVEMCQGTTEQQPRLVDAHFQRVAAGAEDLAHLVIPETFDVLEDERLAIERWQRLNAPIELPRQLDLLELTMRRVVGSGEPRRHVLSVGVERHQTGATCPQHVVT